MKTISLILAAIASATAAVCAIPQEPTSWAWTGWGGGGYFWAAAFDPTAAGTLYMGGDVLGMYKSTDCGKSWKIINRGLHNYGVYSVAIARSRPQTVYAMTQDGIARSTDGGASWTPLPETRNTAKKITVSRDGTVRGIAVHPRDEKILYAGTATGEAFKSTDGGDTWTQLDFTSALKTERAAAVLPARGEGFLWLAYDAPAHDWSKHGRVEKFISQTGEDWSAFNAMTAQLYLPSNAPGTLKASLVVQTGDGWKWQESAQTPLKGGTWTPLTFDLTQIESPGSVRMIHIVIRANGAAFNGDIGIDAVTLTRKDAAAPRVIGDWNRAGDLDGWRASPAADAAFAKSARSSFSPAPVAAAPVASLALSEADPDLVFIAHTRLGLFRSVDAGQTWTHTGAPATASHVMVSAKNPTLVYGAFGRAGVWKSTDAGLTWQPASAFPDSCHLREIAIDPRDPNVVHGIARQGWNGTFVSTRDGGKTWTQTRKLTRDALSNPTLLDDQAGGDAISATSSLALSAADPDTLFIAANWINIISHDSGRTWVERDHGADITCFHDIRFADGSVFAVAMDEGLFRSDDNGSTWRNLAPIRHTDGLSGHQWRVHARKKPDGQFTIVSTVSPWRAAREYPNAVIVSTDSGKTFARAAGLPDYLPKANTMWGEGHARALAADPQNPATLYLGIDGDPEGGKSGGGVFKSTDGGLSWRQLPVQPSSRRMFYGLAVDPADSRRLYWGTGGNGSGVWITEDGGASWNKAPGISDWIFNIEAAPSGKSVYAGGNSLWKSTDKGKSWDPVITFNGLAVVGIAIDPANENRVWISAVNWGGGDAGGIYRTLDGGATWSEITGDIPYRKPLILRYNPATRELWAAGVGAFKTRQ